MRYIYAGHQPPHTSSYLEIRRAWAVAIARKWWHRVCTMTTERRPRAAWAQTGIGEQRGSFWTRQGKTEGQVRLWLAYPPSIGFSPPGTIAPVAWEEQGAAASHQHPR